MASYDNFADVWFTVQALRMFHNTEMVEILVVDNSGQPRLKEWAKAWCGDTVRVETYTKGKGTTQPRQRVFSEARGEWVLCIDSHVMLAPRSLELFHEWTWANMESVDLLHGPMLYDDLRTTASHMADEWRDNMWGTWQHDDCKPMDAEREIPMHGLGLFGCRRETWLGFNADFRGFGGEEGYIHEKYRQAGRKVLLLPFLRWVHKFNDPRDIRYPLRQEDRVRNYLLGFEELGLDPAPIFEHFGEMATNVMVEREVFG